VATAYGCDLSYEYVSINAEYSTWNHVRLSWKN
jgi:hypothetical protein